MQFDYRLPSGRGYNSGGDNVLFQGKGTAPVSSGYQNTTSQNVSGNVTIPRIPTPVPRTPTQPVGTIYNNTETTTVKKPLSPFLVSIYNSVKGISDPAEQTAYIENQMTQLQERLNKYEFRLARGQSLTPEQQQQYLNIRNSYNDLQDFRNDPGSISSRMQDTDIQTMQQVGQIPTPLGFR